MDTHDQELEGYVDGIDDRRLTGWAWAPQNPQQPVDIEVAVDGIVVGRYTASAYRPDLERAEKGEGRHAFELELPAGIVDGRSHRVRVCYAGTNRDLHGSPRTINGKLLPGVDDGVVASRSTLSRASMRTLARISGAFRARPRLARGVRGGVAGGQPVGHPSSGCGAQYASHFGGLWTDISNASAVVEGKRALGWISPMEAALLMRWIEDGFVILPQAIPHDIIDLLDDDIESVWSGTATRRCFVEFWEDGKMTIQPASPRFRRERAKLLDVYAQSEAARQIVFAPPILRLLMLLFERPVVAFQSLYFRWGSQQDIHQDSAFVKVTSPLEFVATWVALEDIQPRSGELEYYVGSHRLEDYLFGGREKWMPLPFDAAVYQAYIASLDTRCRKRDLERAKFLPKKGDVLVWSANLAHGGSKDAVPGVTRKSLVTHYCPANCEAVYGQLRPATRYQYNDRAYYTCPARR